MPDEREAVPEGLPETEERDDGAEAVPDGEPEREMLPDPERFGLDTVPEALLERIEPETDA